jgi:hypothetical protein
MVGDAAESPVLFCFDGSAGSRAAMRSAVDLVERPVEAVVLTVSETIATRLALSGAFAAGNTVGGADLDAEEEGLHGPWQRRVQSRRASTDTAPRR